MHAPWLGMRRIAFIPVLDSNIDTSPPGDFREQVEGRVWFDPDPSTGVDRSLQRYIATISNGRAQLEPRVFPVASDGEDSVGTALRSLPDGHGYTLACAVMLSGGPHRTGFAWWHASPVNGVRNFARVNLDEGLGVWAMEILHIATEFGDLYHTDPHLGDFDNMAGSGGTHPSAHTKLAMEWLDSGAVVTKHGGGESTYDLHAIGLPQPRPPGRRFAVRIPSQVGTNDFMVEARLRAGPYEGASYASNGIPSEGVIVYEVAAQHEVYLRTAQALSAGETFQAAGDDELEVRVAGELTGGFAVAVGTPQTKDGKDSKDTKDTKEDSKEVADKEVKDVKDSRDKSKELSKEKEDKEHADAPMRSALAPARPAAGSIEERVAALEALVHNLLHATGLPGAEGGSAAPPTPFIRGDQRPDLTHSALYEEEDFDEVANETEQGSAQAKHNHDGPPQQ